MARFTPGELEVMQVLWQESPLKPAQIEARLRRPIGNAALRSVLRVLLEKGTSAHEQGKAYYYRQPAPPGLVPLMARRMASPFFGGSS